MPHAFELVKHDDIFQRLTSEKVLLNHQDILNSESKAVLDQLIMKNYSDDNLSLIPSCSCGEITGTYYVGETCGTCKTIVTSGVDDDISFLLWCQRPQGVEKFINPVVLNILVERYKITKPNVSLVKYIMLPNLPIDHQQRKNKPLLESLDFILQSKGIKRGYNSFIQNFFEIVEMLEFTFGKAKKVEKEEFVAWIKSLDGVLFNEYLPFPNRIVFAIDSNELGDFIDKSLLDPINSMRRLTGIDLYTKPPAVKQNKVAKSLIEMGSFYFTYMHQSFFIKPALIRKHISSSRSHFTLRTVITSIPGPHIYDEIYLPWSLSCTLFREHILGQLRKKGWSYKKAVNHLLFHNKIFCPIINEIFADILACSQDGIKSILNRNPSLHRGSVQAVRVTRFKTDPDDNTISMSYLIAKSFNADYDGDALNFTLTLTKPAIEQLVNFEPHHSVLGLSGPNEFSNCLSFPKTVTATLANWFNDGIEVLSPPS